MSKKPFEWAVIGAGPAGIAAVGKLQDSGIAAKDILWIDPAFKVGDLGTLWPNVSSNTTVALFLAFLTASKAFHYDKAPPFPIDDLPKEETCKLAFIAEPLQWITRQMCTEVNHSLAKVRNLDLKSGIWTLSTDNENFQARKVIVATGSVPLNLDYSGVHVMNFETAIDKVALAKNFNPQFTYGVFGSSHSAVIVIQNLVELKAGKIINFYRSPCTYAVNLGDWTLFDNTGLKGQSAVFAREHIDGLLPPNLVRHISNEENITHYLPECDQVIYAVGFGQRHNILVNENAKPAYNPRVGIIGPGLFGFGIGFPELKADPFGYEEYQVGLWKFMVYLNKVLPVWSKYHA